MNSKSKIINTIRLFRTSAHPCSYKDDEEAVTVFVDPEVQIDKALNTRLSELGYRRSGVHLYRPDCDLCSACMSCRVPVQQFRFSRRHRKTLSLNQDLSFRISDTLNNPQAYALYKAYINTRHHDGDMYPATPEQFQAFIKEGVGDTRFVEFHKDQDLVAVSVMDQLETGLSAVYTFFDPNLPKRSLGNFVILWLIQAAAAQQLPYVYLGYWIKGCAKMQYKSDFRPIEMLHDGKWILLN